MSDRLKKKIKRLIYLRNELFNKDIETKILYLHIPKCGGTSVDAAFRKHFKPNNTFKEDSSAIYRAAGKLFGDIMDTQQLNIENNVYMQKYRETILLYNMYREKYNYISGHFSFSDLVYESFKKQYIFITILRNPEKRFISEYFYNKSRKTTHFPISEEIETFLNSRRATAYGTKYVRMLGGFHGYTDFQSDEAIKKAKLNLKKIDIIGILEDLDVFIKNIKDKLDIKLNIGHKNKSPLKAPLTEEQISKDNMEKIKQLCRPDKEIYEFALSIYKKNIVQPEKYISK